MHTGSVGGARGGSGDPWFVARKDLAANTLQVVQGHDHPWLKAGSLSAGDAHWVAGAAPPAGSHLSAKTRYRQSDAHCGYQPGSTPAQFSLEFAEPQWAVTPGQSAVLYEGEVCIGGGVIAGSSLAVV